MNNIIQNIISLLSIDGRLLRSLVEQNRLQQIQIDKLQKRCDALQNQISLLDTMLK